MGADGALQLALNYPDVFGIAGAHSPVLRPYEIAPEYYGSRERFERFYPVTLAERGPEVASALRILIDVGSEDGWFGNTAAFHEELVSLGVPHEWQVWPGEHNAAYWTAHVPDDLRFYGAAFSP
jgi:enterochelin esterase-like enzyme